jgi:hypothetical protein
VDLRNRAEAAERADDLAGASAVHNLAALIASDCGLPDLARQWCHHHTELYLRAHPLDATAARHALEPLVNLARLHIRDGHGDRAVDLIESLYTAVADRADATVCGVEIPANLTPPGDAHQQIRRWLWTVLLATSARALAVIGRWNDATTRLRHYKGIGRRMLDGRQVAVIAHATRGDTNGAIELLNDTEPGDPWENAVTASLTLHCCGSDNVGLDTLLNRYHELDAPTSGLAVFHTRLALSFIDTLGAEHPRTCPITSDIINQVIATHDGYAAHDVLGHDGCRAFLTDAQTRILADRVESCALDRGTIPTAQLAHITTALASAEDTIARILGSRW